MKNTIKFLGVIALVAIIGFSMIACEEDGDIGLSGEFLEVTETTANVSGVYHILISNVAGRDCEMNIICTYNNTQTYIRFDVEKGLSGGQIVDKLFTTGVLQSHFPTTSDGQGVTKIAGANCIVITTPPGITYKITNREIRFN